MKAFGSYVLWVALPLLPAILVFRIFPNTALRTDGPLKGLRVDTAGAFVAYFVVFLVLGYPLLHSMVGKSKMEKRPANSTTALPRPSQRLSTPCRNWPLRIPATGTTIAQSRITAKPSTSIRRARVSLTIVASITKRRATTIKRSRITTRRSASIRITRSLSATAARLG